MDMQDEDAKVEILTAMMGGSDPETARRVLRKHKLNVEAAAQSLLEGNDGLDIESSTASYPPPRDTGDDAEMSRALRASLEESGIGKDDHGQLRPSNRAPDLNWALTTVSSDAAPELSQEEQSFNRAIQESLSHTWDRGASEAFTQRPLEEMIRKDERPVALRPSEASHVYAALLIQALCYVPQVRQSLASWISGVIPETNNATQQKAYKIAEMFVNMEHAILSEITIDELLEEFGVAEATSNMSSAPGDSSATFFKNISFSLESAMYEDVATKSHNWPRLFFFRHALANSEIPTGPFNHLFDQSVVRVEIRGDDHSSDLMTCLSNLLSSDTPAGPEVIFNASDVITFHLARHDSLPTYSNAATQTRTTFRYPKELYLDQFMKENYEVATARRAEQRQTLEEIQTLSLHKSALTHFKGKDVIKDLTSTLHYYESVASKSTPERKISVEASAQKLRKILAKIQNQLETIDVDISKLRARSKDALEGQDLQKCRYDLRAVLVHDGQFGRTHVYSYIRDKGKWWMTTDYEVTEVASEETVLRDASGLHYGAGPYMLVYSRAISESIEGTATSWPEALKSAVRHNNDELLKSMQQEGLTGTKSDSSIADYATPSSMVANASPAEPEPMDITE